MFFKVASHAHLLPTAAMTTTTTNIVAPLSVLYSYLLNADLVVKHFISPVTSVSRSVDRPFLAPSRLRIMDIGHEGVEWAAC
jgi:hypothetical protein